MRGVYIHIPFCKSICSYCDFCKFLYNDKWAILYLNVLDEEIKQYYENDIVKSIYIGGGTPSSLSINNLHKLFGVISQIRKTSDAEVTFECNINDIDETLLRILKENGVNRLSIGIESFNKKNLEFMDREYDKKIIVSKINLVHKFGFKNINVDLIYALPNEKCLTLNKDINSILKLNVNHISTYSLIIEPHTKIYNEKVSNISEELDYKMYKNICKKLKKNNFIHYEVSNFAKDGYESVHNNIYWNNEEYYGFGLGSHGYINNIRYENTRNFNKYLSLDFRLNELLVSTQEEMENEIILGLRKLKGISISKFYKKYKKDIFKEFNINEVLEKGYLVKEDDFLYIPESKIYVMNEILNMILR